MTHPSSPFERWSDYEASFTPYDAVANFDVARAYRPDAGSPPLAPFFGTGNAGTVAGTPTVVTTDPPCFINADGSNRPYLKLDPGDQMTFTSGGSNLETHCIAWVRIDSLPATNSGFISCITPSGGWGDGIGITSDGKFYLMSGAEATPVTNGTDTVVRNLGEWYHVVKINDGGGGSTGHWLYVNGVRLLNASAAGGVKNSPGKVGSTLFDGALAYFGVGRGTTSLTDADVMAHYLRGIRKQPTFAAVL
jgi:hypothetical protein